MTKRLLPFPCVLAALALLALGMFGCTSHNVRRLTDFRYAPLPKDAPIEAFFDKAPRPCEPIAIIQTDPRAGRAESQGVKRQMLDELKQIARKLGADAIQDVRMLTSEGDGWVKDPATPFPSLKQGPYEISFLRGVAVKYIDPGADLGPPEQRPLSLAEDE